MLKFGLQLHTIRTELTGERDVEIMRLVKDAGYSYVQAAGDLAAIERTAAAEKSVGLDCIGSVTGIDRILDNLDEAVRIHKEAGATDIGISSFLYTAAEMEEYLAKANDLADRLAPHGITLSYHNHSNEFIILDNGRRAYDMLIDGLTSKNAYFMPDTYWIAHGGADVRYYIEKLKGRIRTVHLKDTKMVKGGFTFGEVGCGNLYWQGIIECARDAGAEYYVVEQDKCDGSALDSMRMSAEYLIKNF